MYKDMITAEMENIAQLLQKYRIPSYRYKQIKDFLFRKCINNWQEATSLPRSLREILQEYVPLPLSRIQATNYHKSSDNSEKVVFKLKDKNLIEAVLIPRKRTNTLCISSQVGCPVGCIFCATGKMGFLRNLSAQEIVDQYLFFCKNLQHRNEKITNIVFMGMGEPMLNLNNVKTALKTFTDKEFIGFSQRRIVISTSGYLAQLKTLLQDFPKIKIAISLHAASQEKREMIMPIAAKVNSLDEIVTFTKKYTQKYKKRISIEYILLENINDTKEDAQQLIKLFQHENILLNLIPYNPIDHITANTILKRPSNNRIHKFKDLLQEAGINTTIRKSAGEEIAGACGQLATVTNM